MSDILGETDGLGLVLYSGTRDDLQAKLRKRDDEITRLRSLLKEAAMALTAVMEDDNVPYDESCANHEWGRTVLSRIKGEA